MSVLTAPPGYSKRHTAPVSPLPHLPTLDILTAAPPRPPRVLRKSSHPSLSHTSLSIHPLPGPCSAKSSFLPSPQAFAIDKSRTRKHSIYQHHSTPPLTPFLPSIHGVMDNTLKRTRRDTLRLPIMPPENKQCHGDFPISPSPSGDTAGANSVISSTASRAEDDLDLLFVAPGFNHKRASSRSLPAKSRAAQSHNETKAPETELQAIDVLEQMTSHLSDPEWDEIAHDRPTSPVTLRSATRASSRKSILSKQSSSETTVQEVGEEMLWGSLRKKGLSPFHHHGSDDRPYHLRPLPPLPIDLPPISPTKAHSALFANKLHTKFLRPKRVSSEPGHVHVNKASISDPIPIANSPKPKMKLEARVEPPAKLPRRPVKDEDKREGVTALAFLASEKPRSSNFASTPNINHLSRHKRNSISSGPRTSLDWAGGDEGSGITHILPPREVARIIELTRARRMSDASLNPPSTNGSMTAQQGSVTSFVSSDDHSLKGLPFTKSYPSALNLLPQPITPTPLSPPPRPRPHMSKLADRVSPPSAIRLPRSDRPITLGQWNDTSPAQTPRTATFAPPMSPVSDMSTPHLGHSPLPDIGSGLFTSIARKRSDDSGISTPVSSGSIEGGSKSSLVEGLGLISLATREDLRRKKWPNKTVVDDDPFGGPSAGSASVSNQETAEEMQRRKEKEAFRQWLARKPRRSTEPPA